MNFQMRFADEIFGKLFIIYFFLVKVDEIVIQLFMRNPTIAIYLWWGPQSQL